MDEETLKRLAQYLHDFNGRGDEAELLRIIAMLQLDTVLQLKTIGGELRDLYLLINNKE